MKAEVADVWRVLDEGAATLALVIGDGANELAAAVAGARGAPACHVSSYLTVEQPDGWTEPEQKLQGYQILVDLEVLFSPEVRVDPLRLLTRLSRRHSLVAVWPGDISVGVATYSEQDRRDYYSAALPEGVLVVRSRTAKFPDESMFELEGLK